MNIRQLFEDNNKHITFCFGRMNPPTVGHKAVFDTMSAVGGDMRIFLSQSQDPKKNPLSYSEKIDFLRKILPSYASDIVEDSKLRTPWQVASYLYDQGYRHATFVGGDDRESMYKQMKGYNGKEGPHGFYDFETFDFVSSGAREDDAEGLAGVSATKARNDAANGDLDAFITHTGAGQYAEDMFKAVRAGMGISGDKESVEERYQRKLKSLIEGDLAVTSGSVRGVVIDLIKDKIMQTNDYEQISQWLKMIVGKSIKPRGDKRYTITSEDIKEAIRSLKESTMKASELEVVESKARNYVAKNAPKSGAGAHKDKKKAEKQGYEKHKGKMDEASYDHPGAKKLAEIGRKVMDMSIKVKDDKLSNMMSTVGDELTRFGAPGGARTPQELEKRCGCPMSVIEKIMKAASKRPDVLDKVKDPDPKPEDDDEIGDFKQ
jgi:hypothetical protein